MATLYDYLAGLDVDGSPLVWSYRPLKKSEIDAAGGMPYVRVEELPERVVGPMYGHTDVIEAYVDAMIYQAPGSDGRMPDRSLAMRLYFDLYDAVESVDSWVYGQSLIGFHREMAVPPGYDEDTGGLVGMIRFRLLFPRG